jgi:hypothetical protein
VVTVEIAIVFPYHEDLSGVGLGQGIPAIGTVKMHAEPLDEMVSDEGQGLGIEEQETRRRIGFAGSERFDEKKTSAGLQ